MIRRPPRSTQSRSSAASDVYKRQWSSCAWYGEEEDSGGAAAERSSNAGQLDSGSVERRHDVAPSPGGVAACGRALCILSCIEDSGSGTIASLSHMSPATRPGNDCYLPRRENPHPPPPNTSNNTTIRT